MRHAEAVTFGGSGLNRAAEVRGDAEAFSELHANSASRSVALWRGKPLMCGEHMHQLVHLPTDHPLFAETNVPPIFLGLSESGAAVFARDVSAFKPAEMDEAQLGAFFDPSQQRHPSLPDDHAFCELRGVMSRLSARDAELAATAKALYGWHRSHRFCAACGQESRMVQSGWQRDCPACNTSHFPRTDPVVIMLITHGNRVLMGRSPGWPEGMYSLLAGFVEPGETLEAAVRREVFEEAGIKVGEVSYLASQPWPYPSSLMFGCAGEALSDKITIDTNEIEDAIWVTREEMMEAFAGQHPVLKPARKGAIAHFILRNWLADRLD
ncbi:NAD+ diphosphatase [Shimia isoporae]|uniref:NAD(+) diphosphatase n=1 Tax=Shimia isoporae TaxID=647720 RepID=A0A4R1NNF2_9RHOB|nr:NAD(+) diphosphatase [Shimia isoporae]TCL08063.1 NAD+ diphosphatase [Shimia isoporae]